MDSFYQRNANINDKYVFNDFMALYHYFHFIKNWYQEY